MDIFKDKITSLPVLDPDKEQIVALAARVPSNQLKSIDLVAHSFNDPELALTEVNRILADEKKKVLIIPYIE